MGKIYRRDTLIKNVNPKAKTKKNRKRNQILNFRVTPEEKIIIENRIAVSGLAKAEFFIKSCLHQEIQVTGNIKTFDEIRRQVALIDEHLCSIDTLEELDLEVMESLRTVVEILNNVYGKDE